MNRNGNARRWSVGLSLGLALLLAPVLSYAQQNNAQERQQQKQGQSQQQQQKQQRQGESQVQAKLPQALEDLDLTEEQKQQIQQKIRESNRQIAQTWQQFHQLHMQAVNLEAAMLATVEQNLSDSQREQFRKSRKQQPESQPLAQREQQRGQQEQIAQREQQREQQQDQQQRDQQQPQRRESAFRPGSLQSQEDVPEEGILILGISVRSPREQFRQMGLSEEEQQKCGEACQQYTNAMRNAWKKLHALHLQMVELEADKVASIQEVLTDEQLQKLQQATSDSENGTQGRETDQQQQDQQQDQQQNQQQDQPQSQQQDNQSDNR